MQVQLIGGPLAGQMTSLRSDSLELNITQAGQRGRYFRASMTDAVLTWAGWKQ